MHRKTRQKFLIIFLGLIAIVIFFQLFFPYQFQQQTTNSTTKQESKILWQHKQESYQTLQEIPPELIDMLISIEDKRYWQHLGIDFIALSRALVATIFYNKTQGASTIPQQFIKLDHQWFERSWLHKFTELRWALNISLHHSKDEILLKYINIIPFSQQVQGWKAACQRYWGKECKYLSPEERYLMLATSQLGANPYDIKQQTVVIERAQMLCASYTPDNCSMLSDTSFDMLSFNTQTLDPRTVHFLQQKYPQGSSWYNTELSATIDKILQSTVSQRLAYQANNCCVVILDAQGELLSMNMCTPRSEQKAGKINMCLVPRQTGSAIKPFLYLYAFQQLKLHPQDTIIDDYIAFKLADGNLYTPQNFDLNYHGEVSLAYALGNSLNIPAVKLLEQVGVEQFLNFLQQQLQTVAPEQPITTKDANNVGLSLALGTYEISPYHFTQLWRILTPQQTPVAYEAAREEIINILSNPNNKVVSFGQDNFVTRKQRAIKTGTSRKFVDGWICGIYIKNNTTICLRLGNHNNQEMKGASSEVGGFIRNLLMQAVEET